MRRRGRVVKIYSRSHSHLGLSDCSASLRDALADVQQRIFTAGFRVKSQAAVTALLTGLGASCTAPPLVDPLLEESVLWYTGVAGRVDNARARDLLLRAAADEDPISRMWIARVYSRGRMNFEQNEARARAIATEVIDRIETLAGEGVAEAVFLMGTAYDEGLGKSSDIETAAGWYRRAAEMGHGLAQHNLGNIYFAGRGVPQSDSLAVVWWTKAADDGDAIPQLRLGMMYEQGRGVAKDLDTERRWYSDAAGRGNAEAREALDRLVKSNSENASSNL